MAAKLAAVAPNLKEIGMSTYSQRYMDVVFGSAFRRAYSLTKYGHLLSKALQEHTVGDLRDLTLVDYGGGHGTLSLLAKEAGVGEVVHSDIFATSSKDAQLLATTIKAASGPFFLGDTHEFREQMGEKRADIIVNYDVLEHVYNFRQYFLDLAAVSKPGARWFMGSGASQYNDRLLQQLLETHERLEGKLGDGNDAAYVNVRSRYILELHPGLLPTEVERLALATRGWRNADIERAVDIYISSGHIVEFCPPLNNTSDPRNGNWGENMVSIETYTENPVLKNVAATIDVEASAVWNSFITGPEDEVREWIAMEKSDLRDVLRKAPYYCLNVKLL